MKENKKEKISLLVYQGSNIAFERVNGKLMVNATQMAKPFGVIPKDWLRTQQSKDLVKAVSKRRKCLLTDLQHVKNGGDNRGTWFHEDVALMFAQWLSPEFYLECNDKLKELLQAPQPEIVHGVSPIIHAGKAWYGYREALRSLGYSTKGSASRRKAKYPEHFKVLYGQNFISAGYFKVLGVQMQNRQLLLDFEAGKVQ